ncbi:3-oxoadipate enol-lactonase [Phytohabitans suffuscus]|uniref:3-oxoadipate enol-lactonase n=1 Tax=Phytohabitans suffuscus TaxID=624315 RepID=A0A6F8YNB5_9ACTN|nr:3-oxoadipate enol-lactonase [Phytohabitans suffuscus]BCB87655.1 3-oxoadipate enol-lactonase [Phytohabitans suffuscus]
MTLYSTVDGPADAPVLVLANSLGTTVDMWEPQLPALVERYRVVRFDTRGHGRSAAPPGPYTIGDLGGDVLALLDDLGVARAHYCGLSLGGMVGMWLAAHAPERVDRLVLCCTSARPAAPESWAHRAATVRAEGTGAIADLVVSRWLTPGYASRQPDLVVRLRAMLAGTHAEGYASCCGVIETLDLTAALPRITAPTLVVHGADDPAILPSHGADIAAAVPGARLTLVRDAAHLANVEQTDVVTALIVEHLRGDRE